MTKSDLEEVPMTEESYSKHIECYLISRNWHKNTMGRWKDKTKRCEYECHQDVALAVQIMRDRLNFSPWYKRLWGKI